MLHLTKRFFGFLTAQALSPAEQIEISHMLDPALLRLFYLQRVEDQRHAFEVANRVAEHPDLIEAALLHDIGKTWVTLGAFGRVLATLWGFSSLPIWGQWRTYLEHGPIGAELLEEHGAGYFAIAFTRHHPGPRVNGFDPGAWSELSKADRN